MVISLDNTRCEIRRWEVQMETFKTGRCPIKLPSVVVRCWVSFPGRSRIEAAGCFQVSWPMCPSFRSKGITPSLSIANGDSLEAFTLNFTITNQLYTAEMEHPGSSTFNSINRILQHLVRWPRHLPHFLPVPLYSAYLWFQLLPSQELIQLLLPFPAWPLIPEQRHWLLLLWMQADVPEVRTRKIESWAIYWEFWPSVSEIL